MAHRNGMRITTVNPQETSMCSCDESDEVRLDKFNYSICKYQNGKICN